jgi:Na+-translocating ferredoxin:NAD+ oxidoreductase RnfD subunit
MSDSVIPGDLTHPTDPSPVARERFGPRRVLHSGLDAAAFVNLHARGAVFPVIAGLIVYGWRALGAIAIVLLAAAGAVYAWRRIGSRGAQLRYDHAMWLGLLLAMTLPAHLFGGHDPLTKQPLWPILAAGGIILVISVWLLGGIGAGRVHPVLVTFLLLFIFFRDNLVPMYALERRQAFYGDIFDAMPDDAYAATTQPWLDNPDIAGHAAFRVMPASEKLSIYTRGGDANDRTWTSLEALLRDQMPRLEDLIVGGQPAPIGCASAAALIIGGLFLLRKKLIDYRVPLFIFIFAIGALLVLPVPVVIRENEVIGRWVALRNPTVGGVGWKVALTLVSYELMAGPLMFTAFFLATSSAVRPIARRARVIYAALIGLLTAMFQLYVSVSIGPYLALLTASLFTPTLDKTFSPRTLV